MNTSLRPSEIRFSQNSINSHFHDGRHVNEVAEDITSGFYDYENSGIKVYQRNGEYYTRNNRMLYAYRVAEERGTVDEIPVEIVPMSRQDVVKFSTKNNGAYVKVRNDAETLDH